ncbi:uncharacterized protein LOC130590801 [Beta vulgaris subsp. vulgaris]|uniref:uncharacterized protein LOC130590801 n=1 Tax=Beta vulgaris subsp. vulgaris TaxID=3555 RepID=UPI0025469427|nr:uncharacterized protein LOC130590801 [Beta vulgaris subsp. vulgaris]
MALRRQEAAAAIESKNAQQVYMQFLQQKAKGDWLRDGDLNTKVFHRSIRKRQLQNAIFSIHNEDGVWVDDPQEVNGAFLQYYQGLLGARVESRKSVKRRVVQCGPLVSQEHCDLLLRPVNGEEVKQAVWSIHGDRAPGPDGFGSQFYKDCWHIVGRDIIDAVTEGSSPDIIMDTQGAFVHSRNIMHNIMICQDMVHQYGKRKSRPSCMMKIDMRKAYDTVEWRFLREMLENLGFLTDSLATS